MPLTDAERRALEQLEAQLKAEDPRFVSAMVADPVRKQRHRRAMLGGVGIAIGIGIAVTGFIMNIPILGAVGLIALVLATAYAFTPSTSDDAHRREYEIISHNRPHVVSMADYAARHPRQSAPRTGSFMARMEERWDKRRYENQGW